MINVAKQPGVAGSSPTVYRIPTVDGDCAVTMPQSPSAASRDAIRALLDGIVKSLGPNHDELLQDALFGQMQRARQAPLNMPPGQQYAQYTPPQGPPLCVIPQCPLSHSFGRFGRFEDSQEAAKRRS